MTTEEQPTTPPEEIKPTAEEKPATLPEEVKPTAEELEAQRIAGELRSSLAIAMKVYGEKTISALIQQAHREQKVFFMKQEGLQFASAVLPQQAIDEYSYPDVQKQLNEPYPTGAFVRILLHRGETILVGNFSIPESVTSKVASG